MILPKYYFLTKGVGRHKDKLIAFENALRDAGIEKYNLVPVSSILPKNCVKVSIQKGLSLLTAGQIVFCVLARNETNKEEEISSAISVSIPNLEDHGYVAEYHGENYDVGMIESKRLSKTMFKSNFKFFPLDTFSLASSVKGKSGFWSCVISCCVFI